MSADIDWYGAAAAAASLDDLELTRERDRQPVNEFLEQRHPLGSVPGWKACFGARYDDLLVAVVVLGRPVSRAADDGSELSITRFCRRDDRPDNTGSWLIAPARQWAYLEGYETLSAHAGVAGNFGDVYAAVGFLLDCPHCEWTGHPNELVERIADADLVDRFPVYEVGEIVEVCPYCRDPPIVVVNGESWADSRPGRTAREDYERRKWVYELRGGRG